MLPPPLFVRWDTAENKVFKKITSAPKRQTGTGLAGQFGRRRARANAVAARGVALLLCVWGLGTAGCRTAPPMAPADLRQPGWTIQRGQAVWQPKAGAPEVAGGLLIASNESGEAFIRFSKDPMEIVVARRNARGWSLQIPAFDKTYSGRGRPPRRIGWFQLADALFGEGADPRWRWSGIEMGRWQLTNSSTGERLEGFFTP